MNNSKIIQHQAIFESIRHLDGLGNEFWLARQLSKVLGYARYRNFQSVIDRATEACKNSGQLVENHMAEIRHMVDIGSGIKREVRDLKLSRYACYLIVQNGDPSKPIIAEGQAYFAIQTRRQELVDQQRFKQLSEDERRLMLRDELVQHNKLLGSTAKNAGVVTTLDYAVFQDHGYKGLYGGLNAKDLHNRKQLKKSHKILDHMGSTELAANLFRTTQTEEKLRRDGISNKLDANHTHYNVGKKVRSTIAELGGTMPENLSKPEKSIQQLEREKNKQNNLFQEVKE